MDLLIFKYFPILEVQNEGFSIRDFDVHYDSLGELLIIVEEYDRRTKADVIY